MQTLYMGFARTYAVFADRSIALVGLFLWQVKGRVPRFHGKFDETAAKDM
ncbi:hypothetical protein OG462_44495 [Streptomyces sp. NBC_01077]|nr:hypothetical protein OG462_00510 [Streptomyces sp. NBC_01077]WSV43760.1 hypothetical protein OG462_44495 [Streptomyces sp. NBC_01077]